MNKIEQLLLEFVKNELLKNPQLAGKWLQELLAKTKLDPTLIDELVKLLEDLLPVILGAIK